MSYTNHISIGYRGDIGVGGVIPQQITLVWNIRNGPNNKMIAMFRPMVNTLILCNDVQPEYTHGPKGWGWAL